MPDIRERFDAFDRLDMPDLWNDAQRRTPQPAKGSDHERARKAIVIVTALALTVATTGVMVRAFNHGNGAEPVTGPVAEWPTGTVKDLKLSFRYPPQWGLSRSPRRSAPSISRVSLISNTDLTFQHPTMSDAVTSAWDLSDLPADGVVISIEQITGGPADVGPAPADTPLPLDLSDSKLLSPQPDPLGSSPKPAGTEERYLDFILDGQADTVRVIFAPEASAESRAAAAAIVASIGSTSEAQPLIHVPNLSGMRVTEARSTLEARGFTVGTVKREESPERAGTVFGQTPRSDHARPAGIVRRTLRLYRDPRRRRRAGLRVPLRSSMRRSSTRPSTSPPWSPNEPATRVVRRTFAASSRATPSLRRTQARPDGTSRSSVAVSLRGRCSAPIRGVGTSESSPCVGGSGIQPPS